MAFQINKLTDRTVRTVRKPGYHHDGLGLNLQVAAIGARTMHRLRPLARHASRNSAVTHFGIGMEGRVRIADDYRMGSLHRRQRLIELH